MHLLETYSLQTGAKIGKPYVNFNFFPTPEKYITVHNGGGMPSKKYDLLQAVIDLIYPILDKKGIEIVQIGASEDGSLDFCHHLHGKTNASQTAFIIKNSLCHIGNDSYPIHLSSACETPVVGLYSISPPEICGPAFCDKFVALYANHGKKASFDPNESPKTVNEIKIEQVIDAISKMTGIDFGLSISTLFLGKKFKSKIIDFVPDMVLKKEFADGAVPRMRIDWIKDELNDDYLQKIFANLSVRDFQIFIKPNQVRQLLRSNLEVEALNAFKKSVKEIIVDITDGPAAKEDIQPLIDSKIYPVIAFMPQFCKDESHINETKVNLLDFELKFYRQDENNDLDIFVKTLENEEKIEISTERIVLCGGDVYLTKLHMEKKLKAISKYGTLTLESIGKDGLDELAKECEYLLCFKKN